MGKLLPKIDGGDRILEYIQGMSVVKAFGLADRSNKSIDAAINESAEVYLTLNSSVIYHSYLA